jgi:molybdenum cofactor cytidylyltransferase
VTFGEVALDQAEGTLLAHALRCNGLHLAKGHVLSADDINTLRKENIGHVIAVRLEPGDQMEDDAARMIADAIGFQHLRHSLATTGRVNLFATTTVLFCADRAVINQLNRIDPAITFACLADHVAVKAGDMVATVKIIPLAVAGSAVKQAVQLLGGTTAINLKPFKPHKVGLVATQLPGLKPSVMDKTRQVLEARLSLSASRVEQEVRVRHESAAVAAAIDAMRADHDLIIVFGASAVCDEEDVIPASIRMAGGTVDHVGMPVDPGNLLVLGRLGAIPVIGAPGCARSPKENGFDWVLNRILAGEFPTRDDLTGMGVGGLLMEIPSRPLPRLLAGKEPVMPKVGIVLLAAGKASRMGASGQHKLLAEFDGIPLVRRTADIAKASVADAVCVVTGHRADEIAATLSALDVTLVDNPDYATGMASSLKTGLASFADEMDGIVVQLADMPGITVNDLNRMITVFREEEGKVIVRAVAEGKRGNPVILPRSTFSAVMRLEGDVGARHIIEKSGLTVIDIDLGVAAHLDVDTPEAVIAAGGLLKN